MSRLLASVLLFCASLGAAVRTPVVIELFTSEGCSSCPPADALLAELQRGQPVANADVIVLSEHVDYWNSLGWKDPFSSSVFSQRQQIYADLFHSSDVYTPQVIIDGSVAAVGSRRQNIVSAVNEFAQTAKPELDLTISRQGDSLVVDLASAVKGQVWIALTEAKSVSHVEHGENAGRTLQHVGVVRSLIKISGTHAALSLHKQWSADLNIVAFVQDPRSGKILQAVQKKV